MRIMRCHYCAVPLSISENPPEGHQRRTWDHVVPRALGGLDLRWNKVPSCRDCNSDKADKFPTCSCSLCKRARRRHWEQLKIRDPKGDKHRRERRRV